MGHQCRPKHQSKATRQKIFRQHLSQTQRHIQLAHKVDGPVCNTVEIKGYGDITLTKSKEELKAIDLDLLSMIANIRKHTTQTVNIHGNEVNNTAMYALAGGE